MIKFTTQDIILRILIFVGYSCVIEGSTVAESWITLARESKIAYQQCLENNTMLSWSCIKNSSLVIFDKIASCDVIPLTNTARLVKYDDHDPKVFTDITTIASRLKKRKQQQHKKVDSNNITHTWSGHVIEKFLNVLRTHVLQFDLIATETPRHRRRHHQMLPMMLFGATALSVVVVPMGFHFLAVVAGKALLLSKMALMLASINGLKRIATSGVHYGLYHTEPHAHLHSYWDRSNNEQSIHPR